MPLSSDRLTIIKAPQNLTPDPPVKLSTIPSIETMVSNISNPQEPEMPTPPLFRNAQKKLATLERKCQKKAEALQHHRAFHLRIKNIKHSYNYHHPPLLSMLSASIGYTHRRDFAKEISEEEYQLYWVSSNKDVLGLSAHLNDTSSVFSDWQFIVHAIRTNLPIVPQDMKDFKS
ncbi:hypothetical protein C1645_840052 [Glomus cerebriforme]|uniref:Uncharacterized protein n=1 Tax=Glomus cerebriforme TaxID=658196 RepID=A0A397RZX9_9GLOM|nr:hypothetical protein C1645_840052 [Glomus cerebriforme]